MMRRSRFRRTRRYTQNSSYSYKKQINAGTIVSGTGGTFRSFSFAINEIPGVSNLLEIYDFYKITGVKVTFIPRQTENNSQTYLGMFHWVVDYNDSVPVDSADDIMQRQGAKMRYLVGKPFSIFIKPRIAVQLYESTTATGYMPKYAPWINTSDTQVPHYGLKTAYTQPSVGTTIDLYYTFYLKFKGNKSATE